MERRAAPEGLSEALRFSLVEALLGRRSRRFGKGMVIPDGAPFTRTRRGAGREFYEPGAYLETHARHDARWHGQ